MSKWELDANTNEPVCRFVALSFEAQGEQAWIYELLTSYRENFKIQ